MATSPESGLNPARGDDGGAVLCVLSLLRAGDVEFVEVCRTEVGQRMTLEPSPQEFDGVQVRRVRRQERHLHGTLGAVQVLAYELAAMSLQTVPDDQQRPLQMGAQRLEELDVLLLLDRAFVQAEQEGRRSPSTRAAPTRRPSRACALTPAQTSGCASRSTSTTSSSRTTGRSNASCDPCSGSSPFAARASSLPASRRCT